MGRLRHGAVLMVLCAIAVVLFRSSVHRGDGVRTRWARPVGVPVGTGFGGTCVGVTDGDTIRVLRQGREVRVRLWGVDAPEKRQDYGTAAKRWTSDAVYGRAVQVDVRDIDRYGRVVGWVVLPDGRVLNEELVRSGFGWWYRRYAPNAGVLERLENEARSARRGLWADPAPEPPWDFRGRGRASRRG